MDGLDIALLAVAAYLATTALMRLMLARRKELLAELRAAVEASRSAEAARSETGAAQTEKAA